MFSCMIYQHLKIEDFVSNNYKRDRYEEKEYGGWRNDVYLLRTYFIIVFIYTFCSCVCVHLICYWEHI